MREPIRRDGLAAMLRGAAAAIRENHEWLSKLDSVGGDGDHGTTMVRAMGHLEKAVDAASGDMAALLHDVGWAILGVDGGATGPLLGTLFMGLSEGVAGREALDAPVLAGAFAGALAKVRAQTKAQPGDKTMIDALFPAVEAMNRAAATGAGVLAVLESGAAAAEQGAAATRDMQARFGRARNIKEKSIGTQDPGATSVFLLFQGFAKGIRSHA
ncbi:MAG: dihydroxyacetone kinase subunit L [Candidatus Hydrogenedentes bacterium]|nr:dihydroxyacetone kinase subunit L [Candidatus Hydrogenedentota bacterium]